MMKSKQNILLLILLLVHHTSPMVPKKAVESFVVRRNSGRFDSFTVNMKSNHTCTDGKQQVWQWCSSLGAHHASSENRSSCRCICRLDVFYTFLPSMQKCVNATVAANFGGCKEYFADRKLLQNDPVDLTKGNKVEFSVDSADKYSCILTGHYFYDFNGFQSRWNTITDGGFFQLKMHGNKHGFDIKWPKADEKKHGNLFGRIIRLNVSCTNSTGTSSARCILFKASGTLTYYGPVSSSTSSSHPAVSSSGVGSHVPLISTSSSLLTGSSSSLSLSIPLPSSPPPPSLSVSSSSSSSSSSPSVISSASTLSPLPSIEVTSNSRTSASPHLSSSLLPSIQSQTRTLPAFTTGEILSTSRSELQSLSLFNSDDRTIVVLTSEIPSKPSKTTSTLAASSSSAAGGGSSGDRGTRTSGNDNGVVIGAAVGGAVVLGMFVIIAVVFWKWRKAGKSTEKQTKQVKNSMYGTSDNDIQLERPKEIQTVPPSAQDDQLTYQGLVMANGQRNGAAIYSSPEDEYDNCTVYQSLEKPRSGTPVYQSLKAGQAEPAHTTGLPNFKPKPRYITLPNATGTPVAKGNGATAIPNLKGKSASGIPKSKPGTKGQPSQRSSVTPEPVYNVLDGPGSEQGTTPEPLYNVLEGPDRGQDYETTNVDPLYNVLEGPNTTYDSAEIVLESNGAQNGPISGQSPDNDPLYNVLEGPESDQKSLEHGPSTGQEPLYNVLEGPGSKKIPLVEQGGPINEPLYNVLEGPDSGGSNQHAPNKPHPLSGHDNLAYEQTLEMDVPNAAVQRPGTQRESVYEALRGPAQDLYEALGQSGDPHSTC